MYEFSEKSKANLLSCDKRLILLFNKVIQNWDCTIVQGYRSNREQAELLRLRKTTLGPGKSKHNFDPSLAVDVAPYSGYLGKIEWENRELFIAFGNFVLGVAFDMKIPIRWGGDWNGNHRFDDQTFHDLPHFELLV